MWRRIVSPTANSVRSVKLICQRCSVRDRFVPTMVWEALLLGTIGSAHTLWPQAPGPRVCGALTDRCAPTGDKQQSPSEQGKRLPPGLALFSFAIRWGRPRLSRKLFQGPRKWPPFWGLSGNHVWGFHLRTSPGGVEELEYRPLCLHPPVSLAVSPLQAPAILLWLRSERRRQTCILTQSTL